MQCPIFMSVFVIVVVLIFVLFIACLFYFLFKVFKLLSGNYDSFKDCIKDACHFDALTINGTPAESIEVYKQRIRNYKLNIKAYQQLYRDQVGLFESMLVAISTILIVLILIVSIGAFFYFTSINSSQRETTKSLLTGTEAILNPVSITDTVRITEETRINRFEAYQRLSAGDEAGAQMAIEKAFEVNDGQNPFPTAISDAIIKGGGSLLSPKGWAKILLNNKTIGTLLEKLLSAFLGEGKSGGSSVTNGNVTVNVQSGNNGCGCSPASPPTGPTGPKGGGGKPPRARIRKPDACCREVLDSIHMLIGKMKKDSFLYSPANSAVNH